LYHVDLQFYYAHYVRQTERNPSLNVNFLKIIPPTGFNKIKIFKMKSFKSSLCFYFVVLLFILKYFDGQSQNIIIDTDFPGGNIIVENVNNTSTLYYEILNQDTIFVRPDLRDTEGNWFYWYFRITGAENQILHFKFPGRHVGSFGPAYSIDGGRSWQWLYDNIQERHDIYSFKFGKTDNEVMFSMGMPYLQSDFDKFISQYENDSFVSLNSLTTSEKGRNVEEIHIRHPEKLPKYKIVITARHHACEMMASYALEGLITAVLREQSNKWLRQNVEFFIVPFVDKDGVEDGDQGKNRMPYDHNRDYSGESIYKSTKAIREKIPKWSDGILKVALDMHCPGLSGEWHENIYFVDSEDKKISNEQHKFVRILYERHQAELRLNPEKYILEYGTNWNVSNSFSKGQSFRGWVSTLDELSLAISLELPYANNEGQKVTPQNARLFGKDIADAILAYLQDYDHNK
jgi:hypothetical protein